MRESSDILKKLDIWAFLRKTNRPIWIDDRWIAINLQGDPAEYIDIAKSNPNLSEIIIDGLGDSEYYEQMIEFIRNCPDSVIIENIGECSAKYPTTKGDFFQGEQIINQLISEINPSWTDIQKAAYVHYKMGKLISYFPDAEKNGGDGINSGKSTDTNCRSIWGALTKGKSICAGITNIQRTILTRLGIETEELQSNSHSFLMVKTEEGNIITDATWDLMNTLFEGAPRYFGVTYEDLLEKEKGISNAHKLEKVPENVIGISTDELRAIYKSMGIVNENSEYRFPIYRKCRDEIKVVKDKPIEEKIKWLFNIFCKDFPRETLHLSETNRLLSAFFVQLLKIPSENIKSKFVYSMEDKDRENPQLVFYIGDEKLKESVFILNQETVSFEQIEIHDFDKKYTIHEKDIQNGVIPFWKSIIEQEKGPNSTIVRETQQEEKNRSV